MLLLARFPVTVPVLILARKNAPYKLFFNIATFMATDVVQRLRLARISKQ